jgi:hypothetical protein
MFMSYTITVTSVSENTEKAEHLRATTQSLRHYILSTETKHFGLILLGIQQDP